MKSILVLLAINIALWSGSVYAQDPQYIFSTFTPGKSVAGWSFSTLNTPLRLQSIYYPSNFPGMPSGTVKNIYFRIGLLQTGTIKNHVLPELKIGMGQVRDSIFSYGAMQWDFFLPI